MRRWLLMIGGLTEITIAIGLGWLAWSLPNREAITTSFERFTNITVGAEQQITILQGQVNDLQRPEMQRVTQQLAAQTRQITQFLRNSRIDFTSLENMERGLGEVARGLDQFSQSLDPERLRQLGIGLGTAAQFLDTQLVESAQSAAQAIEEIVGGLRKDAQLLAQLLQKAPPDLQAMRDIHDSLGRFDAGLAKVNGVLELQQFATIKEGMIGLETSLSTTAGQVDRLANFTYPVITLNGLKPNVEQRPFWPEGATIAEGLRKAVKGMQAAGTELDGIHKELPTLRIALDDSRKMVTRTREAMGKALSQQSEIESLLREVPRQTASLAERLPKIGDSLTQMLRETKRLREVANALRETQKALNQAAEQWPKVREALGKSAEVLRNTQSQFHHVIENRQQYEAAMDGTTRMAEQFAETLPIINDRLDARLMQQEQTLTHLRQGLSELNGSVPGTIDIIDQSISIGRWILVVLAGLLGMHGGLLTVVTPRSASRS